MTDKKTILWIGAHPDDCEFMCAGTLIHLADRGHEIHIATMTPGDCGSMELPFEEIARVRLQEAEKAAKSIGAVYHCVGLQDLLIFHNAEALRATTEVLRRVQPDIVFTQSPHDYMIDHEVASLLARTACFTGSMPNFHTLAAPAAGRTSGIPYLYYVDPMEMTDMFGQPVRASIYVDISATIDRKAEMLACHDSQRSWLKAQHGTDAYLDEMRHFGEIRGKEIGVAYAEGFRQHLGHAYPKDNILKELLGDLVHEVAAK